MGDLSKNFSRYEFACRCNYGCGRDGVDAALLRVVQEIRDWAQDTVTITSGNRCEKHNADVGGGDRSQHLLSKAADLKVKGKTPLEVYAFLDDKYPDRFGIGRYSSWVHIDVRDEPERWAY